MTAQTERMMIDATLPKIGLVEVFRSVQGEGYNAGRDAIFIRFAGCNLSCVFAEEVYCDTPYQHARHHMTLPELKRQVLELAGSLPSTPRDLALHERTMIVLTGGEPTLQPQFDAIVRHFHDRGFYIAVETNGTRWRDALFLCHWVTVSPKDDIHQGSPSPHHNPRPQDATLDRRVVTMMELDREFKHEYRHVISGIEDYVPVYREGFRHYLSPAVNSDGTGEEWKHGFPGFAPGAVERCLKIIAKDPRWALSIQAHKVLGVR